MDINTYFVSCPLRIATTKLGIPSNYKEKCIKKIYNIGDYQKNNTNVKASMSSWRVWEQTSQFNILLNAIHEVVKYTYPINTKFNTKYDLTSCWTAMYRKNDFTISHKHDPSYLSFTYYLQSDSLTPLVFDDCNFKITPEEDLLVIFPSSLSHHVPKHKSNKDRLVIAGNFEVTSIDSKCNEFAYKFNNI